MKKTMNRITSLAIALVLIVGMLPFSAFAANYCADTSCICSFNPNVCESEIGMIEAGNYHSVFLNPDGTVFAVGSEKLSKYDNRGTRCDVWDWEEIVQVSASSHTVGLKEDGTVVQTGSCDSWKRTTDSWDGIVAISAGAAHTMGLRYDGSVVAIGNETSYKGQCDVGGWYDIVSISAGMFHSLGLMSDGTVVAVGSNGYHQCDITD